MTVGKEQNILFKKNTTMKTNLLGARATQETLKLKNEEFAIGLNDDKPVTTVYSANETANMETVKLAIEQIDKITIPEAVDLAKLSEIFASAGVRNWIIAQNKTAIENLKLEAIPMPKTENFNFPEPEPALPALRIAFVSSKESMSCSQILARHTGEESTRYELTILCGKGVILEAQVGYLGNLMAKGTGKLYKIAYDTIQQTADRMERGLIKLHVYTAEERQKAQKVYQQLFALKEQMQMNINNIRARMYSIVEDENAAYKAEYESEMVLYREEKAAWDNRYRTYMAEYNARRAEMLAEYEEKRVAAERLYNQQLKELKMMDYSSLLEAILSV
jgi:hypothetical protein